ncbi:YecA family protein [Polyangium jinanense]|uniref:SEC-C domain-containing protein n=1 Tax=Polyangium jinanense TaxID=2829994 RepID=A0A9X3XH02_9BACT|nr:SEC-C metal-binding domain-containing protein [Polyangium jinanense]MDC3962007.1 SEC-C domain-containing protein [Polyangium jinanense]MDC3988903.1 SEC-C domain-containing protein [Polyangium jinanense]
MGHAHHFLSRLDRVSLPHVELALSLYRDESLLRYIVDRARVPESVERVALSLDHPEEGPFLIVTRGGRFVTCLGAGMKVSNLPVVTRGQIDAISAKAEELRERLESAKALAGGKGVNALLRRIYDAADELSREEFLAISALQPLYALEFFKLYFSAATDLNEARKILLPTLRKTDKLRSPYEDALRAYWQTFWALGHLIVLATLDGQETLPPGLLDLLGDRTTLSWPATRQGFVALALRGAWATARIGKPLLGRYKRHYQEALSLLQNVDSGVGLFALGMRHTRLRAEVEKTLGADIPALLKGTVDGDIALGVRGMVRRVAQIDRESPEAVDAMHRDLGAQLWLRAAAHMPPGPYRFERAEDVPADLAYALPANTQFSYLYGTKTTSDALLWLFTMVPWAARAAPEELYLPRAVLRAFHVPWRPQLALDVLCAMRDHKDARKRPVARPEGPARKGPCPCGSGKKYKRCCEEKEEEAEAETDITG